MLDAGIAETVGGAVLFVDVDRFKAVNDRHTHAVGDQVLRRVADILRAHCRGHDDVVVRFGGDEFVVLLPMTATTEAAAVAERVRAAVDREPWGDLGAGLQVSVSVGVAAGGAARSGCCAPPTPRSSRPRRPDATASPSGRRAAAVAVGAGVDDVVVSEVRAG
ncbi:hypothetical protein GCM10025868_08650 [Angustibacter aerolatus]|uniref:GGDEF domain-containing protein n=1 Tax=Angustibacter aerolatus TaxID=1162965 RepID=A0ABQ6JFL7_9ACTN|nr:hypothetical protein GCM10025868_08650 [Angustibacter aerolatus]